MPNQRNFFKLTLNMKTLKTKVWNNLIQLIQSKLVTAPFILRSYKSIPIQNPSDHKAIYFFQTSQRKRESQLVRAFQNNSKIKFILDSDSNIIKIQSLVKSDWIHKMNTDYINEELTNSVSGRTDGYTAEDLKLFKDQENWEPWQIQLFYQICDELGDIRPVSSEKITCIQDSFLLKNNDNSEVIYFFKYLLHQYPEELVKIIYRNNLEFCSDLFSTPSKSVYIIEVAISSIKSSFDEKLRRTIEKLKMGIISKSETISDLDNTKLLDPPHVIVLTDRPLNPVELNNKWSIFEINSNELQSTIS